MDRWVVERQRVTFLQNVWLELTGAGWSWLAPLSHIYIDAFYVFAIFRYLLEYVSVSLQCGQSFCSIKAEYLTAKRISVEAIKKRVTFLQNVWLELAGPASHIYNDAFYIYISISIFQQIKSSHAFVLKLAGWSWLAS